MQRASAWMQFAPQPNDNGATCQDGCKMLLPLHSICYYALGAGLMISLEAYQRSVPCKMCQLSHHLRYETGELPMTVLESIGGSIQLTYGNSIESATSLSARTDEARARAKTAAPATPKLHLMFPHTSCHQPDARAKLSVPRPMPRLLCICPAGRPLSHRPLIGFFEQVLA